MTQKALEQVLDRYRVTEGKKFRLKNYHTDDEGGVLPAGDAADAMLAGGVGRLAHLQEQLYAAQSWAVLAVLQGIDAGGKDGTIRHVTTGVNAAGIQVTSFKQPGPQDLAHDYLWRVHAAVPERGMIGIFNRSHYEEVLACRVHPELLEKQHLPEAVRGKKFWKHRLEDIAAFETYLTRQGVAVVKFFLHLSKDEQKRRFLDRIDQPAKNWKFNVGDLRERDVWDEYHAAAEAAIAGTAAEHAPWYVVPADHKKYAHLIVVGALVQALEALKLREPALSAEQQAQLQEARAKLAAE